MKRNFERTYWLEKDGMEISGTASDLKKRDDRLKNISDFYNQKSGSVYGWKIVGVQTREYALYKGDKLIDTGTKAELMKRHNIKLNSFYQLSFHGRRRNKNVNRSMVIEVPLNKEDYDTMWRY